MLGAQAGDRPSVEALFIRLLPRVRTLAAHRMGLRESELWEREDLVQETMLDAFLALDGFIDRKEGALLNWLATLVHNNLTDHQRWRKARKRGEGMVDAQAATRNSRVLSDSVFGVDLTTPQDLAQAAELELKLEEALLALDESKRRVIELRKVCKFSFEEIAKELGFTSASSARSLFSRAMAELAEQLE